MRLRIILAFHMALIYYTQDFRVYEETRDKPMPGPFPAPPIFWREKPWGRGWYSLWWPIQGGSAQKGYLSQASCIWKGRDFTNWRIKKGREICHLGLPKPKGPNRVKKWILWLSKVETNIVNLVPRALFPGLRGGAGKAPWGRGCNVVFLWGNTCLWINS